MITYEEELEVKKSNLEDTKGDDSVIWDLVSEVPLQWLEDYHLEKGLLNTYVNLSNNPFSEDASKIFGVAFYSDGSIASGFQIDSFDPQFFSEKEANAIHVHLEGTITSTLDKDTHLQFVWCALDEDEETLKNFERDREGLPPTPSQAFVKKNLIQRERKRLYEGKLKSYRSYCFVNTPRFTGVETSEEQSNSKNKKNSSFSDLLYNTSSIFSDIPKYLLELTKLVKTDKKTIFHKSILSQIEKNINSTLAIMRGFENCPGITVKPVNATQIYRMLRRVWSCSHWKVEKLGDGKTLETLYGEPLKYGLPSYYLLEDVEDRWGWTWKTGSYWHRILSLRIPPSFADIGTMVAQMTAAENCNIYNSEYYLTLRPTKGTYAAQALHANLKLYRKQFEGNPKEHENLKPIIEAMSNQLDKLTRSDGTHVFQVVLMLHIWDKDPGKLDQWETGLMRTFSLAPLKARFSLEQFNALVYFCNYCTPGWTRSKDNHRAFTYLADEAVTHIPLLGQSDGYVQDDPKGRRAPMIMETHRGTLYAQDDFARGKVIAFNGIAVGTSGSGKSMFYNLKISRTFSPRDIFVIIDGAVANGSYRQLANILVGQSAYIETGLDLEEKTHGKNPLFTEFLPDGSFRTPTVEEISMMVSIIEPMVREKPGMELTLGDRAQISTAIQIAFENFRENNGRVYLRSVAKALRHKSRESNDSLSLRARAMAQQLEEMWCHPRGTYRFFVDVDSSPTPKHLTVYDLKGISQDSTLKGVVVSTYLNHIFAIEKENSKKPDTEKCRIWIIIDEGWSSLMDPIMVKPLIGLYRAGRARNISVHCLTQQMADFKKILISSSSESGDAAFDPDNNSILGNTTWFNLFKHDPQDVKVTQEVLRLPDNQAEEIMSLGSGKGYKEMIQYIRLNNSQAFNKLIVRPLPWELCAFSSDAKDQGIAAKIKSDIWKMWSSPEESTRARRRVISELVDAGFSGAEESLSDEQAVEILTAYRMALLMQKTN